MDSRKPARSRDKKKNGLFYFFFTYNMYKIWQTGGFRPQGTDPGRQPEEKGPV